METWLTESGMMGAERTFVVTCAARVALRPNARATSIAGELPRPLSPLFRELVNASPKRGADVWVVRPDSGDAHRGDASGGRVWIIDPASGPREVRDASLEPRAEGEQPLARLAGDEIFSFEAEHGTWWSRLPGGEVRVTLLDTAPRRVLRLTLDVVVIDAGAQEATLFWRATLVRPIRERMPDLSAELVQPGAAASVPPPALASPALPVEPARVSVPEPARVSVPAPAPAYVPEPARVSVPEPARLDAHVVPPAMLPVAAAVQVVVPSPTPSVELESASPAALELETVAHLDADREMGLVTFMPSLRARGLTLSGLAEQRSRWQQAKEEEARRGKHELRARYDEAFVARLEELRGAPISPLEYARVSIAVERLHVADTFAELGLPATTLPIVRRAFIDRTARSASLRDELAAMTDVARIDEGR